ncbi:signal recognition particle-docking protein FtsY [Streptococcus uberis]|uniref:signal recognition particle-docking protein FtsY n=1 Tax=Streptococcus uberis TaxID=1349 RepID=UPI0020C10760|nr:signal recognition particle-docking protein FtsY [Streptococcus uberis]
MGLFDKLFGKKTKEEQDEKVQVENELGVDSSFSEESQAEEQNIFEKPANSQHIEEELSLVSDPASIEEVIIQQHELTQSENLETVIEGDHLDNKDIQGENSDLERQEQVSDHADHQLDNLVEKSEENQEQELSTEKTYSIIDEYYQRKAAFEEGLQNGDFEPLSQNDITPSPKPQLEESDQEKYQRTLKKTRNGFAARLNAFFANFRSVDEDFFEELEEMLILSDVGVSVATELTEELRQEAKLENAKKPDDLKRVIIEKLVDIYEKDGTFNEAINLQEGLTVMLFVGVNGVGKTTSIGKLAYRYKAEGKKVMLVAADTFRAGAVAQLAEWGRRVDVPVVMGAEKADPASVVFDGVEKAVAQGVDILLIDTAGRLQNKENLMAELEKMGRIIKRVIPDAPHETLLALDASTGQNALSQAKEFSKILPLTGLILTKIDGTAKGGVVLAIRQELEIPVKFIGFGEKIDDIGEFDSEDFMKGLLADII